MIETAGIKTPIGPLRILIEDGVVIETHFVEQVRATPKHPVVARLRAYFAGDLAAIDAIEVRHAGSPFRLRVWEALRRIPAGQTFTYAELASEAGSPNAVRAAGTACGMNQVGVIVPCHRVVRTGGGLGGYAGGLDKKRWLLTHERVSLPGLRSAPVLDGGKQGLELVAG